MIDPKTHTSPLKTTITRPPAKQPGSHTATPTVTPKQPVSDPVYAQGVTAMQSETAEEMSGGLPTAVDTGGEVAGAAGDAASSTARAIDAGADAVDAGADSLGGLARGAGRVLGPVAVAADVVVGGLGVREAWNDESLTDEQRDQAVGEATLGATGAIAGGAGGAWAGAVAGAALGSAVPVVGTLVGGLVGAAIGGFAGGRAGEAAGSAVGETRVGRGVGGFINDLFGK